MGLIIMMRHGQAENNVKRLLAGRKIDTGLTQLGIKQVKEVANNIKDFNIKAVYSSPIRRVRESAEIICKELSLDYKLDDRLIEIDMGKITGLTQEEALKRYQDIFMKFYEDKDSILDELMMERFSNVKKRIDSMLKYVIEKHKGENVLLLTHLDPIKAAIANALELNGKALYYLNIPNASMTLFTYGSNYSLLAINVMDMKRYIEFL